MMTQIKQISFLNFNITGFVFSLELSSIPFSETVRVKNTSKTLRGGKFWWGPLDPYRYLDECVFPSRVSEGLFSSIGVVIHWEELNVGVTVPLPIYGTR